MQGGHVPCIASAWDRQRGKENAHSPYGRKRELEGARAEAIKAQSQFRIDKLVKMGEERNRIAREMAAAHQAMALSSKVRTWLDSFFIEGTDRLFKEEFTQKVQRVALNELNTVL